MPSMLGILGNGARCVSVAGAMNRRLLFGLVLVTAVCGACQRAATSPATGDTAAGETATSETATSRATDGAANPVTDSNSVAAGAPARAAAPDSAVEEHVLESAAAALTALETQLGGRVGVFAFSPGHSGVVSHRADERFAMCSTFKWVLAATVYQRADRGELRLDESLRFTAEDLQEYAPVTTARVGEGQLTIAELVAAAVQVSDNTAANLLLERTGGPVGLTAFARTLGDDVSRFDRDEPLLNMNEAGDERDTTSPRAMARSLATVLTTQELSPESRRRLATLMEGATTGLDRLRAGFPETWRAGDKTGTCNRGACNDVAVVWPTPEQPWFVASYLSDSTRTHDELKAAHAEIGAIVARAITESRRD